MEKYNLTEVFGPESLSEIIIINGSLDNEMPTISTVRGFPDSLTDDNGHFYKVPIGFTNGLGDSYYLLDSDGYVGPVEEL